MRVFGPHPRPLPELVQKKGLWNPRTEDDSVVRPRAPGGVEQPGRRPELLNRLTDKVFFEPNFAPRRGKYAKQEKRAFGYDWSTLPDPAERGVTWADIDSFEQAFCSSRGAAMDGSRSLTHPHLPHPLQLQERQDPGAAPNQPCSYDPSGHKRPQQARQCREVYGLDHLRRPGDLQRPRPQRGHRRATPCVQKRVASAAFRAVGRNGFVVPPEELVYLTRTEAEDGEHDAGEIPPPPNASSGQALRVLEEDRECAGEPD